MVVACVCGRLSGVNKQLDLLFESCVQVFFGGGTGSGWYLVGISPRWVVCAQHLLEFLTEPPTTYSLSALQHCAHPVFLPI